MQGTLCTKSKVIQAVRKKSQVVCKKKIKRERCSTPQRWSRRIRSLPPIPFNVLVPHRKIHRKVTITKRQKVGIAKVISHSNDKKSSFKIVKNRKNTVLLNNDTEKPDSMEMVRIVPVIVYVKKSSRTNVKSSKEEMRVQISGKLLNQAFDTYLGRQIKREPSEKRFSRRIRMLPPCNVSVIKSRKRS